MLECLVFVRAFVKDLSRFESGRRRRLRCRLVVGVVVFVSAFSTDCLLLFLLAVPFVWLPWFSLDGPKHNCDYLKWLYNEYLGSIRIPAPRGKGMDRWIWILYSLPDCQTRSLVSTLVVASIVYSDALQSLRQKSRRLVELM